MHNNISSLATKARETRPAMDPVLRDALIEQHMGLVYHVAARWPTSGGGVLDRDDLVAYGTIGLIEAIDRYDNDRGIGFATFAVHRIRGAMLDAARSMDPLTRSVRRKVTRLEGARSSLTPALGREPRAEELRNAAGLSDAEYREVMTVASRLAISLESVVGGDDGSRDQPGFLQPSDAADDAFTENIEVRELINDLSDAISRLPEREKLVVALYYKESLNLEEIAAVLQVSATRASQLKARAVERLRVSLWRHQAA